MIGEALANPPARHDGTVAEADTAAVLEEIGSPGCALVIWGRRPGPLLAAALDRLPHERIVDIAAPLYLAAARPAAEALLRTAGYPATVVPLLAEDVTLLATLFAALDRHDRFALRLEWLETDACHRFHADHVGTRLLTTYLGRGTQWKHAADPDGAAREMPSGAVAIFKGRRLAPDAPILHRSPPIGGTGARRLLFVVDQAAQGGA